MQKKFLITGATDGIGLETAKMLINQGHYVLLHGRNANKLKQVEATLSAISETAQFESYVADLSDLDAVKSLAAAITQNHQHIDILINNAGVFKVANNILPNGLDVRLAVNTIAPYALTNMLLPIMGAGGRVLNLSSAAQSSINLHAFAGNSELSDNEAYAQSKLALTIWSRVLGLKLKKQGPAIIAINPKSLLGSKMVKDAYGIAGGDLSLGAEVLCQAALCDDFANASGLYFDNDNEKFADPHPDAFNDNICESVMNCLDELTA